MKPAVILVQPQMGQNIGAAARVMLNFGLEELRLVAPRDGWPNEKAYEMAVHAKKILNKAKIYDTTAEAVADIQYLCATSARNRYMVKAVLSPELAIKEISKKLKKKLKCGIMFGPERTGLVNEDIVLADKIVTIPVNPKFFSLNLAQAIAIMSYEWGKYKAGKPKATLNLGNSRHATKEELVKLFDHLEQELDNKEFFKVYEKREKMVWNIRNIFQRADLTDQEVRTIRGIIRSLSGNDGKNRKA